MTFLSLGRTKLSKNWAKTKTKDLVIETERKTRGERQTMTRDQHWRLKESSKSPMVIADRSFRPSDVKTKQSQNPVHRVYNSFWRICLRAQLDRLARYPDKAGWWWNKSYFYETRNTNPGLRREGWKTIPWWKWGCCSTSCLHGSYSGWPQPRLQTEMTDN